MNSTNTVFITGASSGIGLACAQIFAKNNWNLVLGARRVEKLTSLVPQLKNLGAKDVYTDYLDVTDLKSCENFCVGALNFSEGRAEVLINNAGLAEGSKKLIDTPLADVDTMFKTNVYGVVHLCRILIPVMIKNQRGHIINLGSVAGHNVYDGGSVYCATKFAVRALTRTLRLELLGQPVRVTSIDPGMVETEFSIVRLKDEAAAKKIYEGMTPLLPDDIADTIYFAATRPPHVNLDEIILMPTDQAAVGKIHRRL